MAGRKKAKAKAKAPRGKRAPPEIVLRAGPLPPATSTIIKREIGAAAYTQEKADSICRRMVNGESLAQVCRDPAMPAESTVRDWIREDRHGFAAPYARAHEGLIDYWVMDTIRIADTPMVGEVVKHGPFGTEVTEQDMLGHRKLMIDARRWLASKLNHRKYGDKLDVVPQNPDGSNLNLNGSEEVRALNLTLIDKLSARLSSPASSTPAASGTGASDAEFDASTDA